MTIPLRKQKEAAIFEALSSAVRRDMLELLSGEAHTVGEIANCFPISRPAVSKHLKMLTAAGLVNHETRGNRNFYHLEAQGFEAGKQWLDQFWNQALGRFRLLAENTIPEDDLE